MALRLSICIPTHDGRRDTVEVALRSVLSQLAPGVEVCVSDNASEDGTRELIEALAGEWPGVIRYRRNPVDVGGPANLMAAVEMASGDWCWLLSSDDALTPGAVEAACGLIDRHPDASGFTLGWRPYDRSLRAPEPGRWAEQPWNAGDVELIFGSTEELVTTCGPLFDYMSSHVFRRRLWLEALRGADLRDTIFPTTFGLGSIAVRRPRWVWSPANAVMDRMQNHDLLKGGGVDIPALRAAALDDERRVWRTLLADERLQRRVARRWVAIYLFDRQLHVDATHPDTTVRGQLRLLWSLFRATYRSRWFWERALPVLAIPAPLGRRLPALQARWRPYLPLSAEHCAASIDAELPAMMPAGDAQVVRCEVRNLGSRTFRSLPSHPVNLAYRWFDADGRTLVLEGERALLDPPLRPGARTAYELPVVAPPSPGEYRLRVSLVQEQVTWFDDLDPARGRAATVAVTAS